ncbi:hypothetical protein MF672_018650 [Actinomadura sp. ATCC 31491]|uniref:ESX-1 secretion-associated protein n=1 Tax=Actinomadura luzonensis TaxID=2805427 RepID=A0ABT0FU09_9ACTN|nr:hypothetical protein [Actinomadura luzonensis]MCK2215797.1 hypothetical protein [Actinomadura luzonensis]
MGGLDLHFQALEDCASTARRVAKEASELGGGYPAAATDSTIFGKLADSSGLAAAVDSVENAVDGELGQAGSKLEGVERALDKVRQNVRTANRASGADA